MSRIWLNLIRALKSLEMCTLIGAFRAKYIMLGLKKYGAVIFHDTSVSWKIWRKTDLSVGKRHEKFGKFSPVHLEVSTLMGFFCPKQKMHELKNIGELCVMILKNFNTFEEEWTCPFKNWHEEFNGFWPKH